MSNTRKRMDWSGFLTLVNYQIQKIHQQFTTELANLQTSFLAWIRNVLLLLAGARMVGSEDNVTKLCSELHIISMTNGEVTSGAEPDYLPEGSTIILGGATGYTPVYKPTDTSRSTEYALCDSEGNLITTDKVSQYTENAAATGGTWSSTSLEVEYYRKYVYMGGEQ